MPRADYVRPSKNQSQGLNKIVIIAIVAGVLVLSAAGLWLLKSNAPTPVVPVQTNASQPQTKSTLPSRPEEVYSYIRDLETREIRVDSSQQAQLNAEQLKKWEEQQRQEQRRLEEQRNAEQSATTQMPALEQPKPVESAKAEQPKSAEPSKPSAQPEPAVQEDAIAKKVREQEQKFAAEEKRKQQEQRKQEEAKKQAQQAQAASTATAKPAESAPKSSGKFGLQCGAFKNKAQAENMQARLAMAGYNARINSSADWNRVVVGPIGDRPAAVAAQSNAKSVADCVIVAM